jgi:hypothetical protein
MSSTMPRKRFNAAQVAQHAAKATADDRISPPTRDVSLTEVVRALWLNIEARRAVGHPFPRIADWLGTLGYEVSAATLCVYWHRLSKEDDRLTSPAAEDPRPPPAPAITAPAQDTTKPPSPRAADPAVTPVPLEAATTITTPIRPKRPRHIA